MRTLVLNPSQNQDGVSNTEDATAETADKDTTKYHAAGYNPKVSIKVEYVDDEDDGNESDDDADIFMKVDGRYPKCKRKQKEDYIYYHRRQQYKQSITYIQARRNIATCLMMKITIM